MNQQDVEQWISQQGGPGRVQYSRSSREIDNPAADPITAKAAGVPFVATAPAKITISEEKWTAVDAEGKPTGAELHARRRPDGNFDIVDQANPNPTRGNTEDTPEKKNAAELQRQRERNAALPADQDPAYETDADRRTRGDARIKQQGADSAAAEARARQQKIDEQNAATAAASSRRADSAEARAVAAANAVGSKVDDLTINGQHYTRITQTSPDGKSTSIQNFGPDGKAVATLPQEGVSDYSKAPPFVYNWDDPAGEGGIAAWAASVRALPGMTDKAKAEIITSQYGATNAMLARARDVINTQENTRTNETTQRGQDMTQANQRLSSASADFSTAARTAADATKYSEGPEAGSVLPYYLAMAHAAGQGAGGFQNSPQVQGGPAIQQAGAMGLPGQGGSALGRMLPIPSGAPPAVANGVAATQAAAASPTGANVQAANDATMAGSGAAFGALGVTPPQNAALQGANLGPIGPANLFPTPPSGLGAMIQPGGQPQQQPFQPTGSGAMMMQQAAGGYDPRPTNAMLLQAGVDPEIIRLMGGIG